jgi:hypothetical protein
MGPFYTNRHVPTSDVARGYALSCSQFDHAVDGFMLHSWKLIGAQSGGIDMKSAAGCASLAAVALASMAVQVSQGFLR